MLRFTSFYLFKLFYMSSCKAKVIHMSIIKRTISFLGIFLIIYTLNFFLPRLMPGDPITYSMEGGESMSGLSQEETAKLAAYYGLDKPLGEQFLDTVQSNLKGDFGQSIYYKKSVSEIISTHLPWTLYIMLTTLFISLFLGLILAYLCIRFPKIDAAFYHILSVLAEIPSYIIGILLLFLVAANVKWLPLSGNITSFKEFSNIFEMLQDIIMHSILPISAMVLIIVPQFYFVARSSLLSVREKKYVLQAKAKGLSQRRIWWHYLLRNSIFPLISCFFMAMSTVIGGTLLIENVFAYPGLGTIMRESVKYRDYALIQGVFLLSTTIVLCSSYCSDLVNYFIGKEKNT